MKKEDPDFDQSCSIYILYILYHHILSNFKSSSCHVAGRYKKSWTPFQPAVIMTIQRRWQKLIDIKISAWTNNNHLTPPPPSPLVQLRMKLTLQLCYNLSWIITPHHHHRRRHCNNYTNNRRILFNRIQTIWTSFQNNMFLLSGMLRGPL